MEIAVALHRRVDQPVWMKAKLLILILCAGAGLLRAQSEPSKKRLVFPEASSQAPRPVAGTAEILKPFFDLLKMDKISEAYESLGKSSVIASKAENLRQLEARTRDAIDNFGPIAGFERVDSLAVGESLLRETYLSLNADLPLRWRFYFYRVDGQWRVVDLRVDDGIVELFEEAARQKRK
jgi:hypothetical protein